MYAALAHRRAALLDLDLQFGAIPLYFDLLRKRGVLQALENIDSLDEVSFGRLPDRARERSPRYSAMPPRIRCRRMW